MAMHVPPFWFSCGSVNIDASALVYFRIQTHLHDNNHTRDLRVLCYILPLTSFGLGQLVDSMLCDRLADPAQLKLAVIGMRMGHHASIHGQWLVFSKYFLQEIRRFCEIYF